MNLDQLVEKFSAHECYLKMGAGKMADQFNATKDDVKAAKKLVKSSIKHELAIVNKIKSETGTQGVKILIFDIETAPLKAYMWNIWNQNIYADQMISNWFMLSWSAKWLGDSKMYSDVLTKDEVFAENDKRITKSIWLLLDEADIVVAHNGDKYDLPKIRSRFLLNNLPPVTPYRSIDTLKVAKREFGFISNKLDAIATELQIQGKNPHGMKMWVDCMNGDEEILKEMLEYNEQDVYLLEEVYLKFRPHIKNHPNVTIDLDLDKPACTTCGSDDIFLDGSYSTQVNSYDTYRCKNCNSIAGRKRNSGIKLKDKKHLLMPVAK